MQTCRDVWTSGSLNLVRVMTSNCCFLGRSRQDTGSGLAALMGGAGTGADGGRESGASAASTSAGPSIGVSSPASLSE